MGQPCSTCGAREEAGSKAAAWSGAVKRQQGTGVSARESSDDDGFETPDEGPDDGTRAQRAAADQALMPFPSLLAQTRMPSSHPGEAANDVATYIAASETSDDDGFDTADEAEISSDSDGEERLADDDSARFWRLVIKLDADARAVVVIDERPTAKSSACTPARADVPERHELPKYCEHGALSAFHRADTDGDGAVNATDLARWFAAEYPHASQKTVEMLDEMIMEFGWEFDDEEVTAADGTPAVGVQGFVEVWKHLVNEPDGQN